MCEGGTMKLSNLTSVVQLNFELGRLLAAHEAVNVGRLTVSAVHGGERFDLTDILTTDEAGDALKAVLVSKIATCRGKIREFGVDADA